LKKGKNFLFYFILFIYYFQKQTNKIKYKNYREDIEANKTALLGYISTTVERIFGFLSLFYLLIP